ncbi:MAG: hypothetical protein ACYTF3_12825, partial [Planctomycetota bacterium]
PEHSSARIERFLQLAAEGNLTLANCSTAAQYFHLLRRQGQAVATLAADDPRRRPLVVFTPKSLLRDPRAASPIERFLEGGFQTVLAWSSAAARCCTTCTTIAARTGTRTSPSSAWSSSIPSRAPR